MNQLVVWLAIPLLITRLAAQEPQVEEWLPRDACIVAQVRNREDLGRVFGKTQLGALFGDAALQEACARSWQAAQQVWEEELDQRAGLVQLLAACAAFPGRITLGLGWQAAEREMEVRWSVVLDECPAASLEAMRKAIDALLPSVAGDPVALREHELEVRVHEKRSVWLTRPKVLGSRLVHFGGTGSARPRSLDAWVHGKATPPLVLPSAPIAVRLDARVVDLLEAALLLSSELVGVAPRLARVLGFRAVSSLELSVAPADDRVHFDVDLRLDPAQPPGVFRIWSEAQAGAAPAVPGIVSLVPQGHAFWEATRSNLAVLPDLVRDVWTNLEPAVPVTHAEGLAKAKEFFKIDIGPEILARLGDEILVLENAVDEMPEELESGDLAKDIRRSRHFGSCYVMRIREGELFAKALDRALRARGLHAGRKSEDVNGTKVYRLSVLGSLVTYAAMPEHFLVALGEEAAKDLRAVLMQAKAIASASRPVRLPDGLVREIERLPVAVTGVGVQRLIDLMDTVAAQIAPLLEQEMPEVTGLLAPLQELPRAMRRAKVDTGYSLAGVATGRLFWRTVQ